MGELEHSTLLQEAIATYAAALPLEVTHAFPVETVAPSAPESVHWLCLFPFLGLFKQLNLTRNSNPLPFKACLNLWRNVRAMCHVQCERMIYMREET